MSNIFEVYRNNYQKLKFPYFSLEHTTVVDWMLEIGERNTIGSSAKQTPIVTVQHCDLHYVLSKAEVLFKDWLCENKGGY